MLTFTCVLFCFVGSEALLYQFPEIVMHFPGCCESVWSADLDRLRSRITGSGSSTGSVRDEPALNVGDFYEQRSSEM